MVGRRAVLSDLNGSPAARVMLIAEAPGRNGADRTRIPFHGDASGLTFEKLLASIGLSRREIFITNSVLCSPRKPSGANDKPTRVELSNCSGFLRRQIEMIDPQVIVTLGAVALQTLKRIEPHAFALKTHAAHILKWNSRLLVPLYHPSPQVIAAVRPLAAQIADFAAVRAALIQAGERT
ncbi:MAG: uracil-DNA glycosylase [Acidobacteriota bacterium]